MLGFAWPATGGVTSFPFVALVPLLFIEDRLLERKRRGVFGFAYTTFFFWNLISTWWIYCVSGGMDTKLVSVLPAVLINAFFMATVFWLYHVTKKRVGRRQGHIAFVVYWLAFEYLHFNWELSYPWLTIGNAFSNNVELVQWYEFTGVLGGSLWVLLSNMLIFLFIKRFTIAPGFSRHIGLIVTFACLIGLPIAYSLFIYHNYQEEKHPIEVVVIQPNVDPYNEKYSGPPEEQLLKMLELSGQKTTNNTRYLVGPETAIPGSFRVSKIKSSAAYSILREFQSHFPNLTIVMGLSSRRVFSPGEEITSTARSWGGDQWYDSYNSAIQVDKTDNVQLYHKSKLVPGVEMMPFPFFFKHIQEIVFDLGGTVGSLGVQEEPSVFRSASGEIAIAPVICWESIYGEYVTQFIKKGAHIIFIVSNDGWWDETPGFRQLLAYSRLRAIETRRSIARSANTGTSCFINQRGDVSQATEWWVPAVISEMINANTAITFYVRFGDYIGRSAAFLASIMLLWTLVRRIIKKPNP